jgi:potassium efflux system protein
MNRQAQDIPRSPYKNNSGALPLILRNFTASETPDFSRLRGVNPLSETHMHSRFRHISAPIVLALAGFIGLSCQALAQQTAAGTEISRQVIESRIDEVQAKADLDEETRAALIGLYRKTLGFMEVARSNSTAADAFDQARKSAPAETQRIRDELERAQRESPTVRLDLADDASAQEIEQRLQMERANQAAVAARLGDLDQQLAAQANRPGIVRKRLVEASQLTAKLAADLRLLPPPDEAALLTEARRWSVSAQAATTTAEIRMLDQELLSQGMRVELLRAQRDSAARSLARMETRVAMLEQLFTGKRRSETEQVIAESDAAALGEVADDPLVRQLVEANRALGDELQILTGKLERISADGNAAADKLREIQDSFQIARQRLEIAGLSPALGQVLHDQRRDLPDVRQYRTRARQRERTIVETGLRDIQLEAEWRESEDISSYIDNLLGDTPATEREKLSAPLQRLVSSRRALLKNTIAANNEYLRALGDLDFQENQLQLTASEFDAFLGERLLWVRGKGMVGFKSLLVLPGEIIDFLAPAPWLEGLTVLLVRFTEAPWLALAILISGLLLRRSTALIDALRDTATPVGNSTIDNISCTVRAMGISVLLVLPWPLLTLVAGWELSQSLDASDAAKAIGVGLLRLTGGLFFLRAFRVLSIDGGVAEAHFRWPTSVVRRLRVQLDQLLLTFLLPAFVVVATFTRYAAEFGGELGRMAFVIATAGVVVFLIQVLHPTTGILTGIRRSQGHSEKLSSVWLVLGTAIPVGLAIAALGGYVYSALTLMAGLISTLWLVFGLLIAHELVARWLLVVRGRLLVKAAAERREVARAERDKKQSETTAGEDLPLSVEEPELDVASLDADTRKLLNVALLLTGFIGLGAIWSSVLPAFAIFNRITLWQYLDGTGAAQQLVPVTLADLAWVLIYGFITIIAVRTVPSVLEAILRQRDTITPGTRLAFATLARYSIVLLGVSLIAGSVGFNWGRIQWLVAALGVGIGFGLQEIVANFISGLIILVERPIRVGDLVTVGDTSGTVSRLQIRATTVTNFDRQELLVPNKEFITGRVLNWSLSDDVLRLKAQVGVAYGSDIRKALELVKEAVVGNAHVLKDPEPLVTFEAFGDNSLNIAARYFIDAPKKRRETISDINLAINDKLNAAGIVVAFPQRDVHLDTSAPLDIRIQRE